MIGELVQRQIVSLLRDGISAKDIAEQLEIDEALVNLVGSRNGAPTDRDIDDNQLAILRKHAFNLAIGSECEKVQCSMTQFLLERDKPSKRSEEPISGIALINKAIIQTNGTFEALINQYKEKQTT